MFKLIFTLVTLAVARSEKCGERQYVVNGLCCDMCRPGQFVKKNCSEGNYTTCETCKVGTFTTRFNSEGKCETCARGKFFNINLLFCMDCRACPKGQYPVEKCTIIGNTKCHECPEGYYSNRTENFNFACTPCTTCKFGAKRNCTKEEDAICMPPIAPTQTQKIPTSTVPRKKSMVQILTTENTTPVNVLRSKQSQDNTFLILAIVLATLVVLTFFFIYRFIIAKRTSRCQGDKCQIIPRTTKYQPLQTGLLLRDQPASFFLRLAELLTPEGRPNWKDLASNFKDFTYDEIANFAVDKSTAAEKMLSTWQTRNSATVDKLHRCLVNIKREDVATYVADYFNGATSTPV